MSLQFLNLLSRESPSVSHLAVPFNVSHRTHPGDDSRHRPVAQNITQRRFRHPIQRDVKIRSKLLHAFIDLPLSVTTEVIVAESLFSNVASGVIFPVKPPSSNTTRTMTPT